MNDALGQALPFFLLLFNTYVYVSVSLTVPPIPRRYMSNDPDQMPK